MNRTCSNLEIKICFGHNLKDTIFSNFFFIFFFQKSVQKSTNGCDCECTCGGEGEEDPPTRTAGGNRRHRRVMFTDECNCDAWDEDEDEEKGWDDEGRGEGCSECAEQDLHYQSPKEVDGDYSYAYR